MFSCLLVMVFALVPVEPSKDKKRKNYALAGLLLFAIALVGCGGGSSNSDGGGGGTAGTPAGNYTITVTGTSGSVKQTSSLKLTVN
jgi:apolipoprotein N-acyltransferase